ncbi:hypothetical protein K503DRAFT_853889 [Rhizopogon vinicolor AM-OR11-026]|uniref:PHD-type domain-containing protein n=1 Tax=Rhizopogon vinicolor AM-OR11-026 TaxID=1314800 RepID=A0A1B7NCH9_9AGAM|nr:hypothetical protein K503DRAFT_853889 [Rhizopogon vinicolor AM-OR11-026]
MTVSDNNPAETSNEVAFSVTRSLPQHSMPMTLDGENTCPSHPTSTHAPTKVCASSGDASPTRPINSLLPPFSSRNVHLPTPQSPGNLGSYGPSSSRNFTPKGQILLEDILPTDCRSISHPSASSSTFRHQRMITPDSFSPLLMRSRANGLHGKDDKRSHSPPRITRRTLSTREPSPHPQTPDNACNIPTHQSVDVENTVPNRKRPASPGSSSDFLLPSSSVRLQSPPPRELSEGVGGEMARIRAQLLENQMTLTQEAEARRPDYLKRAKRLESPPTLDIDGKEGQRVATVGVTESPMKGRRLMLFQETSDESFEESLMAGGYDRYRTDFQQTADSGPSQPGEPEALPLVTEQELRKQNRLSAFRSSSLVSSSRSQLIPVEIEGCGRVLMNIEPSDPQSPNKLSPSKKKGSRKKKKTPSMDELKDQSTFPLHSEATGDVPNWPDAQFPWRLRSEQRDDDAKLEEEQRLQCIEIFLSRDSDDEDNDEILLQNNTVHPGFEPGRGKMYPLLVHSRNRRLGPVTKTFVPSDPADAKTALLSKRSIRQFSFRRSPRKSTDNDDTIVCICRGGDDGRELVQCDGCHTWYHLQCIGIQSVEDLGREEDPWFCDSCAETPPPDIPLLSEPTFVPTEEKLKHDKSYDPPFFHAGLNPSPAAAWRSSPHPPKTPPARTAAGLYFSSGSSRDDSSSQRGPHTPQFSSRSVRVYTTGTPGSVEPFMTDESPFDPTSTPSRGIKFGAPFATPKNNLWQGRGAELFNTPTRSGESMSSRPFGRHPPGSSEGDLYLPIFSSGPVSHNITPVGQNYTPVGRLAESPLAAKRSRRGPGGGRFVEGHADSARGS